MNPVIFLIGFALMAVSSLAIYAHGSKDPAIRHHPYFHAVVPFIAATAYLAMFLRVEVRGVPRRIPGRSRMPVGTPDCRHSR